MLRHLIFAAAALVAAGGVGAQVGPPSPGPRCLPGSYDGGQTEMATQLELRPDHRFRYGLSYGALDEVAEGTWKSESGAVLLTSDPTTPPRFILQSEGQGMPGSLDVALDVPTGISRQYFSAIVRFADGRSSVRQFSEEGLRLDLAGDQQPVSLTVLLPVVDLESEAFTLQPGSGRLSVRFEPNDLGKVAFAATPLRFDGQDLLLERHDRSIRYRRSNESCPR